MSDHLNEYLVDGDAGELALQATDPAGAAALYLQCRNEDKRRVRRLVRVFDFETQAWSTWVASLSQGGIDVRRVATLGFGGGPKSCD